MYYTIRFYEHNNYYNRIVKARRALFENPSNLIFEYTGNFNHNDGVFTELVFGANDFNADRIPNYCIVYDQGDNEDSSWFVIKYERIRSGSYRLFLKRDSIYDNFKNIMQSTSYVKRGYLDADNPLIFNAENIQLNEVKSNQTYIYNKAKTPWAIAYLTREDNDGQKIRYKGNIVNTNNNIYPDAPEELEDLINSGNINSNTGNKRYVVARDDITYFSFGYRRRNWTDLNDYLECRISHSNQFTNLSKRVNGNYIITHMPTHIGDIVDNVPNYVAYDAVNTLFKTGNNTIENKYSGIINESYYNQLISKYNNKTYNINGIPKTIRFKRINLPFDEIENVYQYVFDITNTMPDLYNLLIQIATQFYQVTPAQDNTWIFKIILSAYIYELELGDVDINTYSLSYDFTLNKNTNQPYEILAFPLNDIKLDNGVNIYDVTIDNTLSIINSLSQQVGCIDVQVVPYIEWDATLQESSDYNWLEYEDNNVIFIKNNNVDYTFGIQLKNDSFSLLLDVNVPVNYNVKESVSCDKYRFVSPNGNGEFEFAPSKNGGELKMIGVECTLIPFQPYINIAPYFSGLYGTNYTDYRGLICGGSFSLPSTRNEWIEFKQNNINYDVIFNRGVNTIDIKNRYALAEDVIGAGLGSISGSVSGAQTGMAGGPIGAIAGAVVGGVTSLAAGLGDAAINERLRQRDRNDFVKNFNWNLQNIQARPVSLSRATSIVIDNKFFPYIEYYTCTPEELELFRKYIKYRGMRVDNIGKISDYIDPNEEWTYVEAQIIMSEIMETNLLLDINEELQKGVKIEHELTIEN